LTTYQKNESFLLAQTKHKENFLKTKKQSYVVLEARQDDMCSNFVQRQTNALQKE
jgi:hypothetical protein